MLSCSERTATRGMPPEDWNQRGDRRDATADIGKKRNPGKNDSSLFLSTTEVRKNSTKKEPSKE